jgi:hypothetical protein
MSRRKASPPLITTDLIAAADAALAEYRNQVQQAREDFDGEKRCREAISSFLHAEEVLWYAGDARPCRCLTSFRENLLAACAALRDANRLRAWEDIDHDALYREYCQLNFRTKPLATYQGARNLFDAACRGELAESTLIEAWDRESMRGVFRWLRVFVAELSDQGAFLNRQRQLVLPATRGQGTASPLDGELTIDDNDERILLYLLEMYPRLSQQEDIVAGARVSRETVRKALARFRSAGVTQRPKGQRKGDGLTNKGKELAEQLQRRSAR